MDPDGQRYLIVSYANHNHYASIVHVLLLYVFFVVFLV